jgi:predicted dienelactone hydrolase
MRRRTVILGLLGAGVGGTALAGCGTGAGASGATTTPASAASILASTTTSTLAPQAVTRYLPVAGRAPARAYAVGRRDFSFRRGGDRPLPTTVWYPATGDPGAAPAPVTGSAPEPGRYPLVLFSHGLTSQPSDYAAMLARWAQAGFVVAGPKYPHTWNGATDFDALDIVNQPADASHVIDELLALGAEDPLGAILDADRLAAAGHSGGGITTTGLFSADRDERLKAGVVLAGTDFRSAAFTGPAAALLFVHGRKDGTVAYAAGHTVFEAVPWSRAMLTITAGGHVTTSADFEATTATSTEFLRWSLYGDSAAEARIPAAAAVGGVATLENQL